MIGMPVRTNAAIWREKCMISCGGTRCLVTSICVSDLRSRTLTSE